MSTDASIPATASHAGDAGRSLLPVVGIGAGAASVDALRSLLENIDPAIAASFLLVCSEPTHTQVVRDVLSGQSRLRWLDACDAMLLERATLYLIPSDKCARVVDATLQLSEPANLAGPAPIDSLFRALSQLGERAIALVLSGDNDDGCLGIKDVKAAGGFVLVQDPACARHPRALHSALEAVPADQVLRPEDIGPQLARLIERWQREPLPSSGHAHEQFIERVLTLLRDASGHDFTNYKRSSVWRRIQRRMQLLELEHPDAYLNRLRELPSELDRLWSELLIGVTRFFRDPEAFAGLERALCRYLEGRSLDTELRVWVPACSTGEEAYSVAIVVHEALARLGKPVPARVFATDVDRRAVQLARLGRFPAAAAADIGAERLSRYFVDDNGALRARKELRELLVFAPQNVTVDPPFSHLDLLVCRNLLIYLEPELQQKVLALFHYALSPRGLLFVGSSEGLGTQAEAFSVVDQRWRIFEHRAWAHARAPRPSGWRVPPSKQGSITPHEPAGLTLAAAASARALVQELRLVRETLQTAVAELETANRERRSTHEELHSLNEELQATSEELETTRQELRLLNDELQTLNATLQERNQELAHSHDDLRNLLNSVQVASLLLDRELTIKRFTPALQALFHVCDSDIGRHIGDLTSHLRYDTLSGDAQKVLESLVYTERAVQTAHGAWRQMRIAPYRTAQDVIDGLMITFVPIDREKCVEERCERLRGVLEQLLDALPTGLLLVDEALVVRRVNAAFCKMFDLPPRRVLGEPLQALSNEWGQPTLNRHVAQFATGEPFAPLRLRGAVSARGSKDLLVTAFDMTDAASEGRYLLLLEDLTSQALPPGPIR